MKALVCLAISGYSFVVNTIILIISAHSGYCLINYHFVKSVQIRSFFWFVFGPNTGKYGPEKHSEFGHFSRSALYFSLLHHQFSGQMVLCLQSMHHLNDRLKSLENAITRTTDMVDGETKFSHSSSGTHSTLNPNNIL